MYCHRRHQRQQQAPLPVLEVPSGAALRVEMRGGRAAREGVRAAEGPLRAADGAEASGRRPRHAHEGRHAQESRPRRVRGSHGSGVEQGAEGDTRSRTRGIDVSESFFR